MSERTALDPLEPDETGLSLRLHFALADEAAARSLASRLIDRAHELANLPECECDVDVDVQWVPPKARGADQIDPAARDGGPDL